MRKIPTTISFKSMKGYSCAIGAMGMPCAMGTGPVAHFRHHY
jgi:hypothetical protein